MGVFTCPSGARPPWIWDLVPGQGEHLSRCPSHSLCRIKSRNDRFTERDLQTLRNHESSHISQAWSFSLNSQGKTASAIDLSDDPVTNWPISVSFGGGSQSQGYQLSLGTGNKKAAE